MSPPDTVTVRGFLADADTGAGVSGLQVELWSANGAETSLVAAGPSDGDGKFSLLLQPESLRSTPSPGEGVEVRVLDHGTLIASELRRLPTPGSAEAIEISVATI